MRTPAIAGWVARRGRPSLFVAAGLLAAALSVTAFSLVTLVLLPPALLFLGAGGGPRGRRAAAIAAILVLPVIVVLLASGLFVVAWVVPIGLVVGALALLARHVGAAGAGTASVRILGGTVLVVGLAASAWLLPVANTTTICWASNGGSFTQTAEPDTAAGNGQTSVGSGDVGGPGGSAGPGIAGSPGGTTIGGPVGLRRIERVRRRRAGDGDVGAVAPPVGGVRADGPRRLPPHVGPARCLTVHLSPGAEGRADGRGLPARTGARDPYHPLVPDARVVQVNVSPGGVPKMPVGAARVRELGLEGDDHQDRTVHGGPFRAVSLFSMEAIRRVQADGHPIEPGSVGENLTLEGLELSTLDAGDRLAIGPDVVLEITQPANPCETIRRSFVDGRIGRISILTHPLDSRLYARVLAEGIARTGDPVQVLPPLPGSDAKLHVLLDRIDANERAASVSDWRAAADGGVDVRFIDDGELAMAATPAVPDENFNRALGLRQLPHLLPDALAFFEAHGVSGWVDTADPPWPGARPDRVGSILAAPTSDLTATAGGGLPGGDPSDRIAVGAPELPGHTPSDRIRVRHLRPDDALDWEHVVVQGFEFTGALAAAWVAAAPGLARDPRMHLLLAEIDGRPAGAGGMFVHGRVAGLGPGSVLPECRRRGVHAALISARIRLAADLGCDTVAAWAALDGPSERNMLRAGLRRIWTRGSYRWPARAAGT